MKMRFFRYVLLAIIVFPPVLSASELILARVSVAEARVTPQVEDKQVLVPTDLEYAIEIETRCESDSVPLSLSIGVADVRHYFHLADSANPRYLNTTFLVPGQQLAPLVTTGYCVAENPDSHDTLLVESAFSAQISLTCGRDVARSVHYLSQPLSVRLLCIAPAEGQESSADSAR